MRRSSVGELAIAIRTTEDVARDAARQDAEAFARAVLERAIAELERRIGNRVVVIRELPLSWRVFAGRWRDAAVLERFAEAIVAALQRAIAVAPEEPDETDDVAVFDDEADRLADFLACRLEGRIQWFHAELVAGGTSLRTIAMRERRAVLLAVLGRLARSGRLEDVLLSESEQTLRTVLRGLASVHPLAPAETSPTRSDRDPVVSAGVAKALVVAQIVELVARHAPSGVRMRGARIETAPAEAAARLTTPASVRVDTSVTSPEPRAEPSVATDRASTVQVTRYGGLLWLASLLVELEVGAALWDACLPEPAVLARAFGALIGDRRDPAVGGISGIGSRSDVRIETVHRRTVAARVQPNLRATFARRGLAELPALHLYLQRCDADRYLIARPLGSALVVHAAPVPDTTALEAELESLAALAWPLTAEPALRRLIPRARAVDPAPSPRAWLPSTDEPETTALLAMVVGWPCLLFAARLGATTADVPDFVDRWLRRPARLNHDGDRIEAIMDASAVDLDIRRAGLDRDAGWLPWSGKHLAFRYASESF